MCIPSLSTRVAPRTVPAAIRSVQLVCDRGHRTRALHHPILSDRAFIVDLRSEALYHALEPSEAREQLRIGGFPALARCASRTGEYAFDVCFCTVAAGRVDFVAADFSLAAGHAGTYA